MNAYITMVSRLRARERLEHLAVYTLASGHVKKEEYRRIVRQWEREAWPLHHRPTAPTPSLEERIALMQGIGFKVRRVEAKAT